MSMCSYLLGRRVRTGERAMSIFHYLDYRRWRKWHKKHSKAAFRYHDSFVHYKSDRRWMR